MVQRRKSGRTVRYAAVVAAVVAASVLGPVTAAVAETVIMTPTVTASTSSALVGVPFTVTFSEGPSSAPAVAYLYSISAGPLRTVAAVGGTATITLTPTGRTMSLQVQAQAADGTLSSGYFTYFYATAATPAAEKDLNGDGRPDLLTVGGTAGLPSGLWQAIGTGRRGGVRSPAVNIGAQGVWGDSKPSEFDGAQVITGHFSISGFQDEIVYTPSGVNAGGGAVLMGSGDGSVLPTKDSNNTAGNIWAGAFADVNGDNPLQLVNGYDSQHLGNPLNDLLATAGDPVNGYYLNYFPAGFGAATFFGPLQMKVPSPDGTADWNTWTLASTLVPSGTALYLWNRATGALYLWENLTVTDHGDGTAALTYQQYKIASHWNKGVALSTLEAADFTGDGIPDLWTVTPAGVARPYVVTELSGSGTASIEAGRPQPLS